MCEPVSIGMAIVAVAGAAMGASEKAKAKGAQTDAERKNQHEIIKAANAQDADAKLSSVDKADEARRQLTEVNLTALRNQGTINTAIGESGLSGNTMDRLKRSVANDASTQKMNVLDNYERDYAALYQNRIGNTENARSAVRGGGGKGMKVNNLANALDIVSSGAGGYAQGQNFVNAQKAAKG